MSLDLKIWRFTSTFLLSLVCILQAQPAYSQVGEEDCVPVNPSTLSIETNGAGFILTDGFSSLLSFNSVELSEALRAKAIIESYGFTKQCFVDRPNSTLQYWLVDEHIPSERIPDDDCAPIWNPSVEFKNGAFKIVDGRNGSSLLGFGLNEVKAGEALRVMQVRNFNQQCFVGRPGATMEYFLGASDRDGDGLWDRWEIFGLDSDGDGVVDVPLPSYGADPDHKDLFLEFDWMAGEAPSRRSVQLLKQAFAAAPIDSGGTVNPDGLPGINLWVDTGDLTDPTATEDGGLPNSCSDGVDNGGDGMIDANDPDCLVGDDLGGGNAIPASSIPSLNDSFYTTKSANFNRNRSMVFRYGLSARQGGTFGGGWGEMGGNDFIEYNHDTGTYMHEFGHTLNLAHGGDVDDNCKPNYVSVMNYDQQFGINQVGGGRIYDYSPPRFPGGRGSAPLPTLFEDNLEESTIMDFTDNVNQLVFVNAKGNLVLSQLNQAIDWNGDGNPIDSNLTVNIDTAGTLSTGGKWPSGCSNDLSDSRLTGHDDWAVLALNFRQFGDSEDGAINPPTHRDPTMEEMLEGEEALNTTDLQIEKSADSLVEVGNVLVYTLTVTNSGPNPASQVQLDDSLPNGLVYVSDNAGCDVFGSMVRCKLGELRARQNTVVEFTVRTSTPGLMTNVAIVRNASGPDSSPLNNTATAETRVVDTTPPQISAPASLSFLADEQCLASGDIGMAVAVDIGDPIPVVTNDAPIQFGTGKTTVTWTATDASGNSASATQTITVASILDLHLSVEKVRVEIKNHGTENESRIEADFTPVTPCPDEVIKVVMGGIDLIAAPFSSFVLAEFDDDSIKYKFENNDVKVVVDVAKGRISVRRKNLELTGFAPKIGAVVKMYIGTTVSLDTITLSGEDKLEYRRP